MAEATISSAAVSTTGAEIVVTISADNPPLLPATGVTGFLVGGVSPAVTVSSAYRSDTSKITLELSRLILSSETGVTISYVSGNVTDSTPENLQTTLSFGVTNNSGYGDQFVEGFLFVLDEDGDSEANATIYCQLVKAPEDTGYAYDTKLRTFTASAVGKVEIPNMVKGASYAIYRGATGRRSNDVPCTIPTTATSPYSLPSLIGRDE